MIKALATNYLKQPNGASFCVPLGVSKMLRFLLNFLPRKVLEKIIKNNILEFDIQAKQVVSQAALLMYL